MRQILWSVLATMLLGTHAAAAAPEPGALPGLTFRAEAQAAGDYIFLKDLAELPSEVAQRYGQVLVWSAPPPGQAYTLTREFLTHRFHQLGLGGLVEGAVIPPAIQVRQTGTLVTREQVAAAFRGYILQHGHWPESQMRIEVLPLEEPVISPERDAILEVLPSKAGRLTGDVTLEMALTRQGQVLKRFKATGKVALEQAVVCAAKPLTAQTAIGSEDVRLCRREVTGLGADEYFLSPDQVVGRLLSRPVGPLEMVTPRHLSHQPVINRGDEVTVILDGNGLTITTKGVAREPGYPGRFIRMLNPKSKKEFQARVVDAKTVRVML